MEFEGIATAVWRNHESDWQMLRFSFWLALALLMLHDSYIECFPHLNCVAKTRMRCTLPELETLPPANAMLTSFWLKVETRWNIHWSTRSTDWGGFDCKNSSCAGRLSRAVPEKKSWMDAWSLVCLILGVWDSYEQISSKKQCLLFMILGILNS